MRRRILTLLPAVASIALASVAVATAQPNAGPADQHRHAGSADDRRGDRGKQRDVKFRETKSAKSAYLNGQAEIGPDGDRGAGDENASGSAVFQIVDDQTISYGFTLDDTDTPQIVHIHRGSPDENGPPVIEFANVPKDADGQASGEAAASAGTKTLTSSAEIDALRRIRKNPRNYYVNMHTAEFPDGAVRGQLSNLLFSNR
jgi:CHRD domain